MRKWWPKAIVIFAMAMCTVAAMAATGILPASAQATVRHMFTNTNGGTISWDGVHGADACRAGTTGTLLWIFNPHSDAVPGDMTITWSTGETDTYAASGWINP